MIALETRTVAGFAESFGRSADLVATAPGRVNLIGEHTDYNDGFVLPMAIGVGTAVAARALAGNVLHVAALDLGESCEIALDDPIVSAPAGHWSNYVRGVAQALRGFGLPLAGAQLAIAGSVPTGAGLSSSASLEVATGLALATLAGRPDFDRVQLALAGQSAEHHYAGCLCGIMDQLVSAAGQEGAALLIDCRSLELRSVAIPESTAVLIVHSGIRRGLVEGEYNARREQCERAAARFGVAALRDLALDRLEAGAALLDPVAFRRARHVITENERTEQAADALERADFALLSRLMAQSHASMRDDFEITTPQIDQLVALLAQTLGSEGGARMTGGGFGGAVVAVGTRRAIEAAAAAACREYRTPAGDAPLIMVETPGPGARMRWLEA